MLKVCQDDSSPGRIANNNPKTGLLTLKWGHSFAIVNHERIPLSAMVARTMAEATCQNRRLIRPTSPQPHASQGRKLRAYFGGRISSKAAPGDLYRCYDAPTTKAGPVMRIEHVITAGWARASLNEAHHSGNGKGEAGLGSRGAFALLGKYCPIGLALLLARYNKDPEQRRQVLCEVISTTRTLAPTYLTKLARRADGAALIAVATLALDTYCRTADTAGAACRCKGRGITQGAPGQPDRVCERCHGSGLRPITGAKVRRALALCLGEITRTDWELRWQPFYLALVAWCHQQEAEATDLARRLG